MGLVPQELTPLLIIAIVWSLPWKGFALWKAAKNSQVGWFVAILLINTLALLDILYIFYFSKNVTRKKDKENTKT